MRDNVFEFDALRFQGVTADKRTFSVSGGDAAVNTGAAAIELKAAVTGKRHWVEWFLVTNITAGQYPVCILQDDAGTPVKKAYLTPDQPIATSLGTRMVKFDPPIPFDAGVAIDYALQTATGDCHASIGVWTEN